MKITITVRGIAGEASATMNFRAWLAMSPMARVMWLHDQCRDVLQGQRFDVISETRAP